MPTPMGDTAPVFPLRLPEELDRRLRQRAKAEGKALNALIVSLLAEATHRPSRLERLGEAMATGGLSLLAKKGRDLT